MVYVYRRLSLCENCMLTHANGECNDPNPQPEPLSELIGEDIALGTDEHRDECDGDGSDWCDCGEFGYCTNPCDGCGTTLHGDRYAAVVFREDPK